MSEPTAQELLDFFSDVTLGMNLFIPPTGFATRLPCESAKLVRDVWELYLETGSRPNVALYVHIPFCAARKWSFCMYHSKPMPLMEEVEAYLEYLGALRSMADTHGCLDNHIRSLSASVPVPIPISETRSRVPGPTAAPSGAQGFLRSDLSLSLRYVSRNGATGLAADSVWRPR
jgi:hypothetical protein